LMSWIDVISQMSQPPSYLGGLVDEVVVGRIRKRRKRTPAQRLLGVKYEGRQPSDRIIPQRPDHRVRQDEHHQRAMENRRRREEEKHPPEYSPAAMPQTRAGLVEMAKGYGLSVSGTKAQLEARIRAYFEDEDVLPDYQATLNLMKVEDLKKLARAKGIRVPAGTRKAELIELLRWVILQMEERPQVEQVCTLNDPDEFYRCFTTPVFLGRHEGPGLDEPKYYAQTDENLTQVFLKNLVDSCMEMKERVEVLEAERFPRKKSRPPQYFDDVHAQTHVGFLTGDPTREYSEPGAISTQWVHNTTIQ
jgi:hypothetical protein